MNTKIMRSLGWLVTGMAICLTASSCRTSLDTQPGMGEKTVTEKPDSHATRREILQRMRSIIIPEVSFHPPATIVDAVDFFKQASRDFDAPDIPPEQRGFSFILKLPYKQSESVDDVDDDPFRGRSGESSDIPVIPAMKARNISLHDALKLVCEVTGMGFRIMGNVVMILPLEDCGGMVTRTYSLDPKMDEMFSAMFEEEMKSFFSEYGVRWPEGSSLTQPSYRQIRVRNTEEQWDIIEQVLKAYLEDSRRLFVHVEMQVVAFQAKDIEKLQLAGGVSEASLARLRKAGKSKPVAAISTLVKENDEAIVKAVQEVLYPSEWIWHTGDADDPDAPQTSRPSKAWAFLDPQNFTMREAGMILQVVLRPFQYDGDSLIRMALNSQLVTLERWKTFQTTSLAPNGKRQTLPTTQPVFSTMSFQTEVSMKDGDTLLLGTTPAPDSKWVHAGFLTAKRVGAKKVFEVREF